MTHVADTHSLVWYLEDNPRLGPNARIALKNPETKLVIPTIVLAEIAFLYGRQRIAVDVSRVYRYIADATNTVIYPLDELVVEQLQSSLNIHDAIIVATALLFRDVLGETTAVISKDTEIVASGLVEVVW